MADQLRAIGSALDAIFAPTESARWLEAQAPVIAKWKAEEEDSFRRYCDQRDMGIKPESLARFFEEDKFEPMYRALRRVA